MKRSLLLISLVLLVFPAFVSCEKEDAPSKLIVGTWEYNKRGETGEPGAGFSSDISATLVLSANGKGSFYYVASTNGITTLSRTYDIIEWSLDNSRLFLSLYGTKTGKVNDTVWRVLTLSKNELKVATEDIYGTIDFIKKKR